MLGAPYSSLGGADHVLGLGPKVEVLGLNPAQDHVLLFIPSVLPFYSCH